MGPIMQGGVVGGPVGSLVVVGRECRPSVDEEHAASQRVRRQIISAPTLLLLPPWILVDSWHHGISIIISRHICSHPTLGVYMGLLAGSVPAGFYGLEWQCGASQPAL